MKKQIALYALAAAALIAVPSAVLAQDATTNAPSTTAPAKKHGLMFHGKVTAVDTNAMTLTVSDMTINITSKTKIIKQGEPATIADITVGEAVGGTYKKDAEGKINASVIHIGAKKKASE